MGNKFIILPNLTNLHIPDIKTRCYILALFLLYNISITNELNQLNIIMKDIFNLLMKTKMNLSSTLY